MFLNYIHPYYRNSFYGYGSGYGYGGYGYPGYGFGGYSGYGGYGGSSIIGSAIANQHMNVIGAGAIGGTQTATPTVIW